MITTVYIYSSLKSSFKNFLSQKKISQKKVFFDISNDYLKYQQREYDPLNTQKERMNLNCDEEDLIKIHNLWLKGREVNKVKNGEIKKIKISFGEYLAKYIYNYMWEHKDDEVKENGGGMVTSIYFTAEEVKKLNKLRGDKKINEYIKGVLGL